MAPARDGAGRIDDDALAAVRRRIGIRRRQRQRFHNECSSADSFRHFAEGYGDDNPLFCDPAYADRSCWQGLVAPPTYPMSAGRTRDVVWTESEVAIMQRGDPLAGIHRYLCGERWVFVRPVRPGDELVREQFLASAELRPSVFGGGTGALLSDRVGWEDREGAPYCYLFVDSWHAERERSAGAAKYRDLEPARYDDDDLERIDATYAAESVRGAEPRPVTDVAVGDRLGPIVKGPLCLTDILAFNAGTGLAAHGGGAGKLAYQARQRLPRLYQRNSSGFWDTAQRCHWEDDWARELGHPAAYDYGAMRTNWMVHLVTNWMGDDAWLWKLSVSIRKFNYMGDTHLMTGSVVSVDRGARAVELVLQGTNQRGDVTCDGRATVLLPTAADARVALPAFDPADVPEPSAP